MASSAKAFLSNFFIKEKKEQSYVISPQVPYQQFSGQVLHVIHSLAVSDSLD